MTMKLSFAALLLALSPLAAAAQAPAQPSATATVERALQALEAREWSTVAEMVDPASLARFRASKVRMAGMMDSMPERAAQMDSLPIPESARAFFQGLMEMGANESYATREFGVATVAELDSLSDAAVFARWLSRNDREARRDLTSARVNSAIEQTAGIRMPLAARGPRLTREVVGEVVRGDTAYVVFRERRTFGGVLALGETRVAELGRGPRGWSLLIAKGLFDEELEPEGVATGRGF